MSQGPWNESDQGYPNLKSMGTGVAKVMPIMSLFSQNGLHPSGQFWGALDHPLGCFQASLATLGDLDGDNLPKVAMGDPLEDEECGAML